MRGHLLLQALRVALVGQNLLLLERFLRESDFNLDYRALIDDASPWLTLVDEELMARNLDRLTLLQVAHQPAKEVRLENLTLYQLDRLVGPSVRRVKGFLRRPNRGYSHDPHTFWHA